MNCIAQSIKPYVRIRLLPNNQFVITRVSKRPSVPNPYEGVREKENTRLGRLAHQIDEMIVAEELINMIGYYCVELKVGTYQKIGESTQRYLERKDRFDKDPLYKPLIPYENEDGVRGVGRLETDRQCERRLRAACLLFGWEYKGFTQKDKIVRHYFADLPKRDGYIWENIIIHRHQLDEIKAKLYLILNPRKTPLDISDDFQECLAEKNGHQHPASKNSISLGADNRATTFGYKARRAMHCSGYVFDRLCLDADDVPNAYFTTLTLPGGTSEAIRTLAAWSGWIQNRLMQVIRDYERKYDIELHWLRTWEWQKRGALHLHLVLGGDPVVVSPDILLSCSQSLKDTWYQLLMDFTDLPDNKRLVRYGGKSGYLPRLDMFERANSEQFKIKSWRHHSKEWQCKIVKVKKSVGRYLSKYTGKSKTFVGKKSLQLFYPARWWGVSRALSMETKRLTIDERIELNPDSVLAFESFINDTTEGLSATKAVESEFVVLYSGEIVKKGSKKYLSILSSDSALPPILLFGESRSQFSLVELEQARFVVYSGLAKLRASLVSSE